jgi:hypothetical protein
MHTNLAHGGRSGIHILLRYLKDSLAGVSVSKASGGGLKPRRRAAAFDLYRSPSWRLCIETAPAWQQHFGPPIRTCCLVLGSPMA